MDHTRIEVNQTFKIFKTSFYYDFDLRFDMRFAHHYSICLSV